MVELSRARGSAAVAVLVAVATAICAAVAFGSDAPAVAGSQPALAIAAGPKLQTLETRIVAGPHTRMPRLSLGTARFTITATNTSTVELTGVAVSDPLSPSCSRRIGALAARASFTYDCSTANVARNFTNVVTASERRAKDGRVLAEAGSAATATAVVKVKPKVKRAHVPHLAFTG